MSDDLMKEIYTAREAMDDETIYRYVIVEFKTPIGVPTCRGVALSWTIMNSNVAHALHEISRILFNSGFNTLWSNVRKIVCVEDDGR